MSGNPLKVLETYGMKSDGLLRELFAPPTEAFGVLRYFKGFADEDLKPIEAIAGKRLRPGLALFIAEAYGNLEAALPVAASVELFHDATLIHDDILDRDELRRGRPSVWKLWGANQATNVGDMQLMLAAQALARVEPIAGKARTLSQFMLEQYLAVFEGQFLDEKLSALSLEDEGATEEAYMETIERKTGVLVGAATKGGGVAAGCPETDAAPLFEFGRNLGLAYQMHDDWRSIWRTGDATGKASYGDLRERKKTLPVLRARDALKGWDHTRLLELYATKLVDEGTLTELFEIIDSSDAEAYTVARAEALLARALQELEKLSLPQAKKDELAAIAHALVTDS